MTVNLIDAFSLYLVLAFVTGTVLRARNYRAVVGLVYDSADRWPKLRALVATHRAVFLRWPTVLPLAVTLLLTAANAYAAHFVWPHARVAPGDLLARPSALAVAAVAAALVGLLDFKAVFVFARLDRARVETVLDRAEHWLGSWKAPAVQVLTLGLVHPRRIVGEQVRVGLVEASLAANGELWATSLQTLARFALGLALWGTWAAARR
ncbi:unnamed protein product [Gemmataceae bacterium]|nr:unnamed protein product [Gemmataceae bacterium]VTT99023.1 unnamed protein product [Gemmataceae bacterium]